MRLIPSLIQELGNPWRKGDVVASAAVIDVDLVERWILLRHAVESVSRKEFTIVQMTHQPFLLLLVEHLASHHLEYTHRVSQFLHPIGVHEREPPVLGTPQ